MTAQPFESTPFTPPAPAPKPKMTIELVGPKEARYLLRQNLHNRHISQSLIDTIARDIVEDHWVLNGETIKVARDGTLLDGQQRLLAIIKADKAVMVMIVRNLENEAQETVDIGRKRSLGDTLTLRGETSTNNLAAATRFAWLIDHTGSPAGFKLNPSKKELLEYLEQNPSIRSSVLTANRVSHSAVRYPPSIGAGLHFLMSRIDSEEAENFWDELSTGVVEGHSSTHVLREILLNDLRAPHRMRVDYRAAITIKAWNARRIGREVKAFGWRRSGPGAEPFPTIK